MNKEKMINRKIENCREDLINSLQRLIEDSQNLLNKLQNDENYKPNSLGVIQSNRIDLLCMELYTLQETKELIAED